jgi:Flp pilus assembly pilin Flp
MFQQPTWQPLPVNRGRGRAMQNQSQRQVENCAVKALRQLANDNRGATAAEFGLVVVIFVSLLLGTTDLSRQIWEINLSKAAVREGARLAAVRPLASVWLQNLDPITTGLVAGNGDPIPAGSVPDVICSGATSTCVGGSNTAMNTTAFTEIVTRMKQVNPRIEAANVVITYRHVGLGFAGNPFGPDVEPEITVSLTGLTISPGALSLFGLTGYSMPALTTTISAEDLT